MIRPATPLTILLGAAFALMLLAVLSVPIIQAIPLGSHQGVSFGVFGTCDSKGCSGIQIGYDAGQSFKDEPSSFDLPTGVRNTLSAVLIVHPVAALLTLVLFIMAAVAHMHSAAHSTRYLLIVFIFLLIDFLVCLCAFLIDVLLFIPHMAWGSYIVLASTILVALSGLVTCAMRRTLIGRKDRQKRIDQNAEMSGENYYNREAQKPSPTEFAVRQPTVPSLSGGNGTQDPSFVSFEQKPPTDRVSDENIPLTRRTTSNRSPISAHNEPAGFGEVAAFNGPQGPGSRDEHGNPINEQQDPYGVQRGPSREGMRRGRGDMGPSGSYRGRGGYGGRGGGYDNYAGSMRGRRSPYGPRGGARGGYVPPYQQRGGYGPNNMGVRGGRSPPPGYGPPSRRPTDPNQGYPQNNGYNNYNARPPQPEPVAPPQSDLSMAGIARAESPPPLPGTQPATVGGQPIEMDAVPPPRHQYGALRDSDADVAGMVGLQQGQMGQAQPNRHDTYNSETSKYSTDEYGAPLQTQQNPAEVPGQYVPPRAAWNQGNGRNSPRTGSPLAQGQNAGGEYYEDVDPRFASNTPPGASANSLVPPPIEPIYEDPRDNNLGSRSPAESEKSTFTSISQRGVNPRWNPSPAPPMPYQQGGPMPRRPVQQQRQDMILDNPDFKIPNSRSAKGPGVIPGSAYPGGRM